MMAVDSTGIVRDVSRKWLTVSMVVVELGYEKMEKNYFEGLKEGHE